MATFEHTRNNRPVEDRPPPRLPEIVTILCGIVLLPFTLLSLLGWGAWKLGRS
jgi:hypothetical protein